MPTIPKQDIAERFGTRAQAERYLNRFSQGRRRRTNERETTTLEALLRNLGHLQTIMDVGSGPGRFTPVFMKHCSRLIQTDFSTHMLAVSKDAYPLDSAQSGYVQSDVRYLPFTEGSADLVFCHRLLNHLPDPQERMSAMANLTRVSRRYVVFSCLGPPAGLRFLRRTCEKLKHTTSIDGHVEAADLITDAQNCNLKLLHRSKIRSFPISAEFYTFEKKGT